ncbi:fatty acid desaturase [Cypionkella aquatica]|uniref:Fatty acid desaturase n=1 Tax=Cypionkella aquatica TaxID=1756042 RepID=A0AA37TVG2_9RHOB|nr:fatty acid desaturase [Cypionkella aquatica]GLS88303.1 fatty acid desaturase [Cypionkella aquatica]
MTQKRRFEAPTVLMLLGSYAVLGIGGWVWGISGILSVLLVGIAVAQFSSLQHEVLHGHPFRHQILNEALVFPALMPWVPYLRFKDTHLQHHFDPALTDPYDDPESNYLDPDVWARTSSVMRGLLRFNNTLAGRVLIGPALGTFIFLRDEVAFLRQGRRRVWLAWGLHLLGLLPVLAWLAWAGMPVWAYLLACYFGTALLKIRTFLEHRAHEAFRARTVVVEDRGPLSYLFLNNNFHVVHHMHPNVPWYELPALYRSRREHYLRRNEAYVYRSYPQVIRQYFWRAKDPVPHPVWPMRREESAQDQL